MKNKIAWSTMAVVIIMCLGSAAVCEGEGTDSVSSGTTKKELIITGTTARARHILVDSEKTCRELKSQIEGGADFAETARIYSKCPSGRHGGDLGRFGRGQMVPEFDEVVFSGEVGKVHGPVKTSFGYHLIEITERDD